MTLERGAFLHNRYRILEILGQGGMGSIYRAIDENLGVEVAVKENLFTTDEYARQFRREAVILANLRQTNLPRVSDHFVIDGQGQYLVMDYIEGEDLRERMDRLGVIPEDEILVIGAAICDALTYMHTRKPPVLHRDIKPGNVKITPQGQIFLVDFGLAKVVQAGQQTSTGARAMTPGYSPPEQYGAARTDHRSDIYSLGATMYAALVGVIPEDSLARTMEQTDLTPVRKRNSRISRRTASAIEKALEVHPDDRFQTAEEFKQSLMLARGTTVRKMVEDGVIPPVSEDDRDALKIDVEDTSPPPNIPVAPKLETPSAPLPVSTPLSDSTPIATPPRKKRRGRGCFWTILSLLFIAVIGVGGAYLLDPEILYRVYDNIVAISPGVLPEKGTETVVVPNTPTETSTPVLPTATDTLQPTATHTPEEIVVEPTATVKITNTPTNTPTPTSIPTETPTPTITLTPSPTPMGGGYGQITFASDRTGIPQIWRANSDGSDLQQIINVPLGACQPDWSPDGKLLVFISPCEENRESYPGSSLYLASEDGNNIEQLPTVPGGDYDPAWSPDGKKIIFTSLRNGDWPQIFLMDISTKEVTQLSQPEFRDLQAIWSLDGNQIIFISTVNGPFQIWKMDIDGSNLERFSVSGGLKNTFPSLSPDGNFLVFTQSGGEGTIPYIQGALYPGGADKEFNVYPEYGAVPMREAVFSPDGFWLALESWTTPDTHDIYIMTPNGQDLTQVTIDPAVDFDPAWRPLNP